MTLYKAIALDWFIEYYTDSPVWASVTLQRLCTNQGWVLWQSQPGTEELQDSWSSPVSSIPRGRLKLILALAKGARGIG